MRINEPTGDGATEMKVIDCKACGSKELVVQNGIVVCLYCQTRYAPDPDVDISGADSVCKVGPCQEAPVRGSVYCGYHSSMKIVRKDRAQRGRR